MGRAVCDWLGGNLASSPRPACSRGVPDASGGMGGTAIDLRWTWARLGGRVRAAAIVREGEKASAMPTMPIPPDLDLHYGVDDFTAPWSKPSTVLMPHGNAE